MQFSLNGLHTRHKSWSRNLPMEACTLAFKTITDEVISECVVWCQPLFWSALHNTSTLMFFQPVSVLSLLISSPFISLLAIILSSVTSLFNNCVVSSNIKHKPTSGPCAFNLHIFHARTWWKHIHVCVCTICLWSAISPRNQSRKSYFHHKTEPKLLQTLSAMTETLSLSEGLLLLS